MTRLYVRDVTTMQSAHHSYVPRTLDRMLGKLIKLVIAEEPTLWFAGKSLKQIYLSLLRCPIQARIGRWPLEVRVEYQLTGTEFSTFPCYGLLEEVSSLGKINSQGQKEGTFVEGRESPVHTHRSGETGTDITAHTNEYVEGEQVSSKPNPGYGKIHTTKSKP
jgi:hypothetical protein